MASSRDHPERDGDRQRDEAPDQPEPGGEPAEAPREKTTELDGPTDTWHDDAAPVTVKIRPPRPGNLPRAPLRVTRPPDDEGSADRAPLTSRITRGSVEQSGAATAVGALHRDEMRRNQLLALFGLMMCATTSGALFYLPGDPLMTRVTWGAAGMASLASFWLIYLTSSEERYDPRRAAPAWVIAALAVSVAVVYFGVFSSASMVVALGVYFVALGQSLRLSLAVYLLSAAVPGAAALLVVFRVVDDPGLVRADYLPLEVLLTLEAIIQIILLAAFVMARAGRRATLGAVTEHARMVRAVGRREALLVEAREDLERALRVGGAGRFTGQTLGSYRLGPVLGRGAMGEVYEADHVTTGAAAAVKVLQQSNLGNPGHVRRFLREVEVAASIDVPHVVRVFEVGDASAALPYLAMERLRGRDLAQILREERRLSSRAVLELAVEVGRGLTAAAQAGVIHRDLKPQNLFLADQPDAEPALWKILDFGMSKLAAGQGTLTQGKVVGTPIYMAPEQAQGLEVDTRADLYALGAILYRCITGHLPFRGRDVASILYQVVHHMPVRPSILASVPAETDDLLLIAMAKNPTDRFATADELARALEDALRGRLRDDLREHAGRLASDHPWRMPA